MAGAGYTPIKQTRLERNVYQVDSRGLVGAQTGYMRTRLYIRGTRLYMIGCMSASASPAGLDGPVPAQFFASFRLL